MNSARRFAPISVNPLVKFLQVAYWCTASHPKHLLSSLQQKCSSPMNLRILHASMIKNNSNQDSFTMNQFLSACNRLHQIDYAFLAFNQMNQQFKEAVQTFEAMKAAGMNPDMVTMSTVISACAHLGNLEVGRGIHRFAVLNGFKLDVYIGSALIDMYAKCGSIGRSLVIFFKLEDKNLFCWNSIIDGLAMHGHPKDVFYMFSIMIGSQVKPNSITFVSILSACAHAGMVGEGHRMFLSMIEHHLITPEIEHYSCMVNLMARAGLLQEALDLIQSMEIVPNSVIWGALLSGCKIHEKISVGKIAMDRLVVLEPSKSNSYMFLIDMFAKANLWEEAAAVRENIKEIGVQKKSPGCSWIEMDGLVHEFAVSDTSHPLTKKIYFLLAELYGHIKWTSSMP